MRICQIIESASGGSVRVALDLSKGLVEAGDEVTFLYSPSRADQPFYDICAATKDVRFIPVDMRRSLGPHDFISLLSLWHILKKEGPFDVLHAHSSKAGGLVRALRPFLPKRTAIVYTPHAFVTMGPEGSRLHRLLERFLSPLCDSVVAVSQGERDHAVNELGLVAKRVSVVVNGIDYIEELDRAEARQKLGLGGNLFVIGFVARFVPQKNITRLIETFAAVSAKWPHVHLAVLGDGPEESKLHALIEAKGLAPRVTLVAGARARPLFPAFDVVLCSSDYEGISLVFLESLAAGVPLVTTPVAGAAETVIDNKTGVISKDFTPESLAQALELVVALSPEKRELMAQAARVHSANFTLNHMVATYRDLYKGCIDARIAL